MLLVPSRDHCKESYIQRDTCSIIVGGILVCIIIIEKYFLVFRNLSSSKHIKKLEMSTVISMPKHQIRKTHTKNGIQIGCFRVCTCMHLGFVSTKSGMLKVFQIILGSCLETLLINFGSSELSATAFQGCLTTVSACLSVSMLLCLCYTLSAKSFYLIRQSLFVSFFCCFH